MIKYKLKHKHTDDIVKNVLLNRGLTIEEAANILEPSDDNVVNPFKLKNMSKAIDTLYRWINQNKIIAVIIDSDCDGMCSGSMIYDFMLNQMEYENVYYILHNVPKAHGFEKSIVEKLIDSSVECIIMPDAGSTVEDGKAHKQLVEHGMEVLILDHHNVECETIENVVIVNPHQEEDNSDNKNLSGTGVTYKFIQAYCREYAEELDHTKYIDLFALSLVSDMCNLRELENRIYLNAGSEKCNIQNPLIKRFIKDKRLDGDALTIEQMAFSISPYVNSVVRMGSMEEKDMLFRSFVSDEKIESKKRGANGKLVHIQEEVVRIAGNIKSKHDKLTKEAVAKVKDKIYEDNLLDNKVVIVDVTGIVDGSLTGLCANRISNDIAKRPLMLIRKRSNGYSGSARGHEKVGSFKELCDSTNKFSFCSGHDNAFGVSIKEDNIQDAINMLNDKLKDIEFDKEYEVDKDYVGEIPSVEEITKIAEWERLWCNNIKEPTFCIKGMELDTNNINKVGNATYTWRVDSVTFTKNFGSKVWYEDFSDPGEGLGVVEVDLIGRFRKTISKGREYYYVDIVDAISKYK